MFVHPGMFFAFLGAEPACCGAGMKHSADHLLVKTRPTGRNPARDAADVRAIKVQSDALSERFYVVFRKTGICAGRAGLCAGVALLDATNKRVVGLSAHLRVGVDNFLHLHGNLLFWVFRPPLQWARKEKVSLLLAGSGTSSIFFGWRR